MNNSPLDFLLSFYVLPALLCILLGALVNRKCLASDVPKFPAAMAFLPVINLALAVGLFLRILFVYVFKPIQKFVGE